MAAGLAAQRERGGVEAFEAAATEAMLVNEMSMVQPDGRRGVSQADAMAALARLDAELTAQGQQVPAPMLARVRFNAGMLQLAWGDVERAHALIEPAVRTLRAVWGDNPWGMQMSSNAWALVEMHRGEHRHADALFRESIEQRQRAHRYGLSSSFVDLARNLGMQGRFDEAEAELTAVMAKKAASDKEAQRLPVDAHLVRARAELKLDRGDAAGALALIPESLDDPADVADVNDRRLLRGAALCAAGQPRDGLAAMETQIDRLEQESSAYDPRLARWRALAGLCAARIGNRPRALELLTQSRAAFVAQPGVSPYFKAPQVQLAARLGKAAAP